MTMSKPVVRKAANLLPGMHLVTETEQASWVGPRISEVVRELDLIKIKTVNGGQTYFPALAFVTTVENDNRIYGGELEEDDGL
jgi:hypothetical protein